MIETPADPSPPRSYEPVRILVADDDHDLREMLCHALTAHGLNIVGEAENGMQALEMYEQCKPDAVLLDIQMPVMDGLAALAEIRRRHPAAVVVMITGNLDAESRANAVDLGAAGFLRKPFRIEQLYHDIQHSLRTVLYRRNPALIPDLHYLKYVLKLEPSEIETLLALKESVVAGDSGPPGHSGQDIGPEVAVEENPVTALSRELADLRTQAHAILADFRSLVERIEGLENRIRNSADPE